MDDGPLGRQLLLQVVLILVNAFFAASEMGMVSLNAAKLRKEAEDGDIKAKQLLKLVETPTAFLSAIQIGITLAGYLGSAFAAENFSYRLVRWLINDVKFTSLSEKFLSVLSIIVITIILSFFTLVFGELVPKRIAMYAPLKVVKFTSPVVRAVTVMLKPVIWLLSISTRGVLRLFGINDKSNEEKVTEDEIRLMVDIGEESGTIDKKERELIDNIFEFNNNLAKDVMTRSADVVSISADASFNDVVAVIDDSGYSRIPVYEETPDNIVGILIVKEFLLNLRGENPKPIREIMRAPYFVPESIACDKLFFDMQQNRNHLAIVIDEYGDFAGIVTLEDLVEEIFGNIYDESDDGDDENDQILQTGENSWRIAGNADIDEVSEKLGIVIPDDIEVNTFGGLVMSCFNEIPENGSSFEVDCHGLHIHVDNFSDRRVESALVSVLNDDETDNID